MVRDFVSDERVTFNRLAEFVMVRVSQAILEGQP